MADGSLGDNVVSSRARALKKPVAGVTEFRGPVLYPCLDRSDVSSPVDVAGNALQVLRGLPMTTLQASAQNQLRQFVEQLERLEEEKKALSDDIRDKFQEAKAVGFDIKALRQILRLRKKNRDERQEEASILEVYMHALGMLDAASGGMDHGGEMLDAAE